MQNKKYVNNNKLKKNDGLNKSIKIIDAILLSNFKNEKKISLINKYFNICANNECDAFTYNLKKKKKEKLQKKINNQNNIKLNLDNLKNLEYRNNYTYTNINHNQKNFKDILKDKTKRNPLKHEVKNMLNYNVNKHNDLNILKSENERVKKYNYVEENKNCYENKEIEKKHGMKEENKNDIEYESEDKEYRSEDKEYRSEDKEYRSEEKEYKNEDSGVEEDSSEDGEIEEDKEEKKEERNSGVYLYNEKKYISDIYNYEYENLINNNIKDSHSEINKIQSSDNNKNKKKKKKKSDNFSGHNNYDKKIRLREYDYAFKKIGSVDNFNKKKKKSSNIKEEKKLNSFFNIDDTNKNVIDDSNNDLKNNVEKKNKRDQYNSFESGNSTLHFFSMEKSSFNENNLFKNEETYNLKSTEKLNKEKKKKKIYSFDKYNIQNEIKNNDHNDNDYKSCIKNDSGEMNTFKNEPRDESLKDMNNLRTYSNYEKYINKMDSKKKKKKKNVVKKNNDKLSASYYTKDYSNNEEEDHDNDASIENKNCKNNNKENIDSDENSQMKSNDLRKGSSNFVYKEEEIKKETYINKNLSIKDNVYESFIREYKNLQSLFSYNKNKIDDQFSPFSNKIENIDEKNYKNENNLIENNMSKLFSSSYDNSKKNFVKDINNEEKDIFEKNKKTSKLEFVGNFNYDNPLSYVNTSQKLYSVISNDTFKFSQEYAERSSYKGSNSLLKKKKKNNDYSKVKQTLHDISKKNRHSYSSKLRDNNSESDNYNFKRLDNFPSSSLNLYNLNFKNREKYNSEMSKSFCFSNSCNKIYYNDNNYENETVSSIKLFKTKMSNDYGLNESALAFNHSFFKDTSIEEQKKKKKKKKLSEELLNYFDDSYLVNKNSKFSLHDEVDDFKNNDIPKKNKCKKKRKGTKEFSEEDFTKEKNNVSSDNSMKGDEEYNNKNVSINKKKKNQINNEIIKKTKIAKYRKKKSFPEEIKLKSYKISKEDYFLKDNNSFMNSILESINEESDHKNIFNSFKENIREKDKEDGENEENTETEKLRVEDIKKLKEESQKENKDRKVNEFFNSAIESKVLKKKKKEYNLLKENTEKEKREKHNFKNISKVQSTEDKDFEKEISKKEPLQNEFIKSENLEKKKEIYNKSNVSEETNMKRKSIDKEEELSSKTNDQDYKNTISPNIKGYDYENSEGEQNDIKENNFKEGNIYFNNTIKSDIKQEEIRNEYKRKTNNLISDNMNWNNNLENFFSNNDFFHLKQVKERKKSESNFVIKEDISDKINERSDVDIKKKKNSYDDSNIINYNNSKSNKIDEFFSFHKKNKGSINFYNNFINDSGENNNSINRGNTTNNCNYSSNNISNQDNINNQDKIQNDTNNDKDNNNENSNSNNSDHNNRDNDYNRNNNMNNIPNNYNNDTKYYKNVKNILLSLGLSNEEKIDKIRKILFYSSNEEKKCIMNEILNILFIYPQLYITCIVSLFYLFILDNETFEKNFKPEDLIYIFNDKIDFRYSEWFLKTYLFYKYKFSNIAYSNKYYKNCFKEKDSKENIEKMIYKESIKNSNENALKTKQIHGNEFYKDKEKGIIMKNKNFDNFFEGYNSNIDSSDNFFCEFLDFNGIEKDIYTIWKNLENLKYVGYNECKILLKICLEKEKEKNINRISSSSIRDLVVSIWCNIPSSRPKKAFIKLLYNWINNKKDDLNKKKNLFYLLKEEKELNPNLSKICFTYFINFLIKYKENCSNDVIYTLYLIEPHELMIYSKKFIQNYKINFNQFISIWNILCILFWDTKNINYFTFFQKNKYYFYDFMLIFLKSFYEYICLNNSVKEKMKLHLKKNFLSDHHKNFTDKIKKNSTNPKNNSSYSFKEDVLVDNSSNKNEIKEENEYLNLFDIENIINNFNFNDFVNNEISKENYFDVFFSEKHYNNDHSNCTKKKESKNNDNLNEHINNNTLSDNSTLQKNVECNNFMSGNNEIENLIFLGICIKIVICRISNLLNAKSCLKQFYYFLNHKTLGLKTFKYSYVVLVYFIPFFKKYFFLWRFIEHEIDSEIMNLIKEILKNLENIQNNTSNIKNYNLYNNSEDIQKIRNSNLLNSPRNSTYFSSLYNSPYFEENNKSYLNNFKNNNSLKKDEKKMKSFKDNDRKRDDIYYSDKKNNYFFNTKSERNHKIDDIGDETNKNLNNNVNNKGNDINNKIVNKIYNTTNNKTSNKTNNNFANINNEYDEDIFCFEENLKKEKLKSKKNSSSKKHSKGNLEKLNDNSHSYVQFCFNKSGSEEYVINDKLFENYRNENKTESKETLEYYNVKDNVTNLDFNKLEDDNLLSKKNISTNNNSEDKINMEGLKLNNGYVSLHSKSYEDNMDPNKYVNDFSFESTSKAKLFSRYNFYDDNNNKEGCKNNSDIFCSKENINAPDSFFNKNYNHPSSLLDPLTNDGFIDQVYRKNVFNENIKETNEYANNVTNVNNNLENRNEHKKNSAFFYSHPSLNEVNNIQTKNNYSESHILSDNYNDTNFSQNFLEKNFFAYKKEMKGRIKKKKKPKYLMLRIDKSEMKKMKKREMQYPPVGLMNLGNTCYLNSLLQALYSTVSFIVNLFLFKISGNKEKKDENETLTKEERYKEASNEESEHFLEELKSFFKKMAVTNKPYISTEQVINILPQELSDKNQQDVTEVFRYMFEKLGGSDKEFLRLIFSGVLVQKVQCQKCLYISKKEEIIHDISFPVPIQSTEKLSIQNFFDTFVQKEKIYGSNKYKCSKCKKKRNALKWNEILSPPCHLILILNRYHWSFTSNEKNKIKTHVKINSKIVVNNFDYKLYGGIMHGGVSASSGHYYFIGRKSEYRHKNENEWYQMDDSKVTKVNSKLINDISEDASNDHTPYVLFYRCKQAPMSPSLHF